MMPEDVRDMETGDTVSSDQLPQLGDLLMARRGPATVIDKVVVASRWGVRPEQATNEVPYYYVLWLSLAQDRPAYVLDEVEVGPLAAPRMEIGTWHSLDEAMPAFNGDLKAGPNRAAPKV